MDGSGKTTICQALEALDSQVITFDSTPKYAYRWLKTYGVGKADEVTLDQVNIRQHVFMMMNEQEAYLHNSLCEERPVVAVRGRADTWISANALRGKSMPRNMETLFPKDLRPDVLVVLTANLKDVEARIDARGESKTGANSMTYHERTREMYTDLATIARRHMPVLTYNTSNKSVTPYAIASDVLNIMRGLTHVPTRSSVMTSRDMKSVAHTYSNNLSLPAKLVKKHAFEKLPNYLKKQIMLAKSQALEHVYPRDKITRAGCVLVSKNKMYTGSNIKRWSWNNTTCCERMAIDQAFSGGIETIDRLILFVTNIGVPMSGHIAPCGSCRELLKEALHHLDQSDLDIYMVGPDEQSIIQTTLSALLPLSGTLTHSEFWEIDD
jgi:cytidine deaminase/broad-specificity NMP kinase